MDLVFDQLLTDVKKQAFFLGKFSLGSHFTLTSFHNSILLCDVDVAIYANKRISRCQKRCSDGKPFYYIAHSDINNTLGDFLFKILKIKYKR